MPPSKKTECPHCGIEVVDLDKHVEKQHPEVLVEDDQNEELVVATADPEPEEKGDGRHQFIFHGGKPHTKTVVPMFKREVAGEIISTRGLDIVFEHKNLFTWNSGTDGKDFTPEEIETIFQACLKFVEQRPTLYKMYDGAEKLEDIRPDVIARSKNILPVQFRRSRFGAKAGFRTIVTEE